MYGKLNLSTVPVTPLPRISEPRNAIAADGWGVEPFPIVDTNHNENGHAFFKEVGVIMREVEDDLSINEALHAEIAAKYVLSFISIPAARVLAGCQNSYQNTDWRPSSPHLCLKTSLMSSQAFPQGILSKNTSVC